MKRVAILGCGPAGLLAAYAAHLQRIDFDILSVPQKSEISGAQYLHMEIPMLTGPADGIVKTYTRGTREGYAKKVYGDPQAPCSWDIMTTETYHEAWSMRSTYDALWEMFNDQISPLNIDAEAAAYLARMYDLVLSTVPAQAICANRLHTFPFAKVRFSDEQMVTGIDNNYIVYNGDEESWYRSSRLFGVYQTEYPYLPGVREDHQYGTLTGIKPLQANCDCHPGLVRLGRFGKWQKGQLVHHAFQEAMHALQRL